MNTNELLRRQWQGYPRNHQMRTNLVFHLATVPLFTASNIALLVGLAQRSWVACAGAGIVASISIALQGYGHMKRTWTIIGVTDVARSFRWYQSLFGQTETRPAHDYWGQILDDDGTVLLCMHEWGAHEHPSLASPNDAQPGNGLLLFFRVDDFDASLHRARTLVGTLDEEPHLNPNTGTQEFALRDPDGYYVMVSSLSTV